MAIETTYTDARARLAQLWDRLIWSRRLTQEHRIVYLARGQRIDFLQARYRY